MRDLDEKLLGALDECREALAKQILHEIDIINENNALREMVFNDKSVSPDEFLKLYVAYRQTVNSRSWKITYPLRLVNKAFYILKTEGIKTLLTKIKRTLAPRQDSL